MSAIGGTAARLGYWSVALEGDALHYIQLDSVQR